MQTRLERTGRYWTGSFSAMASPCELLIDDAPTAHAQRLLHLASREAWRIEQKFSRYRSDSVITRIHRSGGLPIDLDSETADLLDFAARAYELSDGLFDVTSGVLRRAWTFDGSDRIPPAELIDALRPLVGWERVQWRRPRLSLPAGMELDLGGIGKEYAVDRAAGLLRAESEAGFLLNFGGDLVASGARRDGTAWIVGVEDPKAEGEPVRRVDLREGALATSGDSRRFLEKDGVRYTHVLNPRTGWPVADAPRSVTVHASTCTEAGILASLALLQGPEAEAFLDREGVRYWSVR